MSRFWVLFLFLIWMGWRADPTQAASVASAGNLGLFLGFYALLAGGLAVWSHLIARGVRGARLRRHVHFFDNVVLAMRLVVLCWFGVGVFFLGWGDAVTRLMGPLNRWPVEFPPTLIGILPGVGAWMLLWWAQYPAERALREQNLMIEFNQAMPFHGPPTFSSYFILNLRLQILFTAIPLLLILALHDVVMVGLRIFGQIGNPSESLEGGITLTCALLVFVLAPTIVRRILNTQPMPNSPLRRRLEEFCRDQRLRYRDILLWQTNHNVGNAAVMGIIPQVRYILMSDLLLETMSDEQIEAVFAHEVGHIVHRHMIWYLVFFKCLLLALALAAVVIESSMRFVHLPGWVPMDLVMTLLGAAAFLLAFGFLSRRFERQADVFAARQIERRSLAPDGVAEVNHVGPHGAKVFASALHKVALINGMPVAGTVWRNWCHGSIARRMDYLHQISSDPDRTRRFDRFMLMLYALLIGTLVLGGGMWLATLVHGV